MPFRDFRDDAGQLWTVIEISAPLASDSSEADDADMPIVRLAFFRSGEFRELPHVPPDWKSLDEDELQRLLERATVLPSVMPR